LCEYGSTDGSLIAAKWESGMDNAVRFDKRQMIQSNEHAWSIDIESVDLNSYLYQEKLDLASIALILNDLKTEREMKASAEVLRNQINTIFYDEQNGFYYDRTLKGELVKSEASEGFLPLWAKIADQKQADRVIEMLAKENKFNTIVPFPTVCADHPLFNPMKGYWRGPVWLDQFYFGIEGMKKYGDTALSSEMVRKLFTNGEGILTDLPIRENYHPITGKGLNAINFSWSAAHILMLLQK
jgi:putative isomerase